MQLSCERSSNGRTWIAGTRSGTARTTAGGVVTTVIIAGVRRHPSTRSGGVRSAATRRGRRRGPRSIPFTMSGHRGRGVGSRDRSDLRVWRPLSDPRRAPSRAPQGDKNGNHHHRKEQNLFPKRSAIPQTPSPGIGYWRRCWARARQSHLRIRTNETDETVQSFRARLRRNPQDGLQERSMEGACVLGDAERQSRHSARSAAGDLEQRKDGGVEPRFLAAAQGEGARSGGVETVPGGCVFDGPRFEERLCLREVQDTDGLAHRIVVLRPVYERVRDVRPSSFVDRAPAPTIDQGRQGRGRNVFEVLRILFRPWEESLIPPKLKICKLLARLKARRHRRSRRGPQRHRDEQAWPHRP